jgi:hypothetical protein
MTASTISGILRAGYCASLLVIVSTAARSQAPSANRDSLIFVAVVRSAAADTGFTRAGGLRVDPQPLVESHVGPDRGSLAPALVERTRMRRDVLRMIGIPIGDAKRPESCGGIMIPYSPTDVHKGCPKQARLVASVGVPRDSAGPSGSIVKQLSTVRVAVVEIGPTGFSVLSFDYSLEFTGSNWKVVDRRLVGFVE